MHLSFFRESIQTNTYRQAFQQESVMRRVRAMDRQIQRDGLNGLDAAADKLVAIGTESDTAGHVVKNGYGVLTLPWQAQLAPEWAEQIRGEVEEIRGAVRSAHGATLRFVIWAGMGGSSEDKSAYLASKLLNRGPRLYVLDSTDPAKLKNILADAQRRGELSLKDVLKRTLVVGMAMGMTSYEPVVNLEALARLYDRHGIDGKSNFLYLTSPGSLLDRFGKSRRLRKVALQLDGANTTAGRHSAPMTRGTLYPLALAKHDLDAWFRGAQLDDTEISRAFELSAFLHARGEGGHDKVTLLLPRKIAGIALWTKQLFEESLGKSERLGIKVVIDEPIKLTDYRPPRDGRQDRVFLHVSIGRGARGEEKVRALQRAGYPLALLRFDEPMQLSTYQQFMHYVVFGLGYLRGMNFVTQPGVEVYKTITNRLFSEAQKTGGIEKTREWRLLHETPKRVSWKGCLTVVFPNLKTAVAAGGSAPETYARLIDESLRAGSTEYFELTFFGDMRYSPAGQELRKRLREAAQMAFRRPLKMPVDVYEGPAMNHSYHEMIIGHGKCFSTVLLSLKKEEFPEAGHTAEYHRAQFLATQLALAERERQVVAILLRDLEPSSLRALGEFFRGVARHLKALRKY